MAGQAIGGTNTFPSLEDIAQLFRSTINDDGTGQTDAPGQGQIATDTAPFMLPFIVAAMQDQCSDLRIVGDPELILDNYCLFNLPVINGPEGQGSPSPETQVYLGVNGYFDGTQMWPNFKLPINIMNVVQVWERQGGSELDFTRMAQVSTLAPVMQGAAFAVWEWRQGAIWMPGSLITRDIRIRGTISLANFSGSNIDFSITYYGIKNSLVNIVDKMLVRYARRFSPETLQANKDAEMETRFKLAQEVARQRQSITNFRQDFADIDHGYGLASQL